MTNSLLASDFEDLELPDAAVFIATLNGFPSAFEQLKAETQWVQKRRVMFGQMRSEPRLTAWYGDEGCSYTYSGMKHEPLPWTPLLTEMRQALFELVDFDFNSVLLNFYRNGYDSIGFHSDDEKELGPNPTIASISFGGTRKFEFRKKVGAGHASVMLEDHSLLLMMGETQNNWLHGIEKRFNAPPRINLTFRKINRF
jgi:alkylated DNA repair dioxygenase AlkB